MNKEILDEYNGESFFLRRFKNLQKKAWIFLFDYLIYLSQSGFGCLNAFPDCLILEFDDLFYLLVVFLIQIEVKNLYIFELGCVIQAKFAFAVRVY